MTETKNLLQPVKKAMSSNAGEHILNIFKAAASTAPFCGWVASLMSDYIPSSKFRRLENFSKVIAEDVKRLESRLDENLVKTDEFAFVFEQCLLGVSQHYQKEKLEAFRGILINSAMPNSGLSNYEREYFLNLVNSLSVLHIRVLKFLAKPMEYLSENEIAPERIQGGFSQFFRIVIPGIDIKLIESAFGDLYQYGFLNTQKDIFHTMTSSQGLQLLGDRTTELAKKFINFCSVPNV